MTETGAFSFQTDVFGRVYLAAAAFDAENIAPYVNVAGLAHSDVYHVTWQHRSDWRVTGCAQGATLPLYIGNVAADGGDFDFDSEYVFTLSIYSTDIGPKGRIGWRQFTPKLRRKFEPAIPDKNGPSGEIEWLLPVTEETLI